MSRVEQRIPYAPAVEKPNGTDTKPSSAPSTRRAFLTLAGRVVLASLVAKALGEPKIARANEDGGFQSEDTRDSGSCSDKGEFVPLEPRLELPKQSGPLNPDEKGDSDEGSGEGSYYVGNDSESGNAYDPGRSVKE